jgi:SAM-dependent methyltransferase
MSNPASRPADQRSADDQDVFLSFLAEPTTRLLETLDGIADGSTVLDLASGPGEPATALARRRPDLRITGVDISPDQVQRARMRSRLLQLANVEFHEGDMADLKFPDNSFDAVVSRIGALQFGDVAQVANEMARVLRPNGRISVLTWATASEHPVIDLGLRTLASVVPPSTLPDPTMIDALAADGMRAGVLRAAGIAAAETRSVRWINRFPDFEAWWSLVRAWPGPTRAAFEGLNPTAIDAAEQVMRELVAKYRTADGGYAVPTTVQHVVGRR